MMKKWCFVFLLLLVYAAAALALTSGVVGAQTPGSDYVVLKDVPYVNGGSPAQRLDLYLPAHAPYPVPLIVWIHGGGWMGGDKYDIPIEEIKRRGFAAASINYRLSPQAVFPAQLDDCNAAIRWLRSNAQRLKIDKDMIGLWGHSAGGHLALLVATTGSVEPRDSQPQSVKVQAVCDWCGPTDFVTIRSQSKMDGQKFLSGESGQIASFLGGPIEKNLAKAVAASPAAFVSNTSPPVLIMHGQLDDIVPMAQSIELARKLKDAGVKTQLVLVPGKGHNLDNPQTRETAMHFFDSTLGRRNELKPAPGSK